jgi:hypothetical protein
MTGITMICALMALLLAVDDSKAAPQVPTPDSAEYVHPEVTGDFSQVTEAPAIEPLGQDRYRIGELTLDRGAREVRFPATIALREGTLEYLACAEGGKLYESLLQTKVDPYHLHLALLLMGLEPENNLASQGDSVLPLGDPVTIHVSWATAHGRVTHRAEALIQEYRTARIMPDTAWVFSGSRFIDGIFEASMSKSLIAVYNDPSAILNNPLPSGSDDTSYVVRKDLLPPVDTELEIVLRPAAPSGTGSLP